MKFNDLSIGETFDFIDDENPMYNSFFERCTKVSTRKYLAGNGFPEYTIGSIFADVFHVKVKTD